MHEARFTSAQDAIAFMQAGNARFTLRSVKTGVRFTYRMRESEDGKVFFVAVLTGSDNEASYSYLGIVNDRGFRRTAKSRIGEEAPAYKAFAWAFAKLSSGAMPDALEVWHEGHCGRCGRTLTVPESIAAGIGPECEKRMGASSSRKHERDEDMSTTKGRRLHKQRIKQYAAVAGTYPTRRSAPIDTTRSLDDDVSDLWNT